MHSPQIAATIRVGPGGNQELGIPPESPMWVARTSLWVIFCWVPKCMNWMKRGNAGTLTHCIIILPAPPINIYK